MYMYSGPPTPPRLAGIDSGMPGMPRVGVAAVAAEGERLVAHAWYHGLGHKHSDELSFVWFARGARLLVDAGRYGYYYDIDFGDEPITNDDLPELEKLMHEIIKSDVPFELQELPRDEAKALMEQHGEDYKLLTIDKIPLAI